MLVAFISHITKHYYVAYTPLNVPSVSAAVQKPTYLPSSIGLTTSSDAKSFRAASNSASSALRSCNAEVKALSGSGKYSTSMPQLINQY